MDGCPAKKKVKMDNGDSYIPTLEESNGDGTCNVSLIFSLKEQKGELIRSLKPFEVTN